MSRAAEAAQKIQSSCDAILAEASRLPAEILRWKPAPEVWSVMDILCHIEEFLPYWTAQSLSVVAHPDREWGRDHTDEARRAAVRNTEARTFAEVETNIRASANESASALAGLSDADLDVEAPSRNARWGMKPAGFIVEHLLVIHLEKHLGQIRRNEMQYAKDPVTA
jgi:uncharacterized damage-inducible protein DinB